jgi:hypothetical protein
MQDKQELFEDSENKVEGFLTDLAVKQNVAVGIQNQAFNALVKKYLNGHRQQNFISRPNHPKISNRSANWFK